MLILVFLIPNSFITLYTGDEINGSYVHNSLFEARQMTTISKYNFICQCSWCMDINKRMEMDKALRDLRTTLGKSMLIHV